MTQIVAVARPGYDVLTETNPNSFIFHSSYNTFKILLQGQTTITTTGGVGGSASVNHNLNKKTGYYLFWRSSRDVGLVCSQNNEMGSYTVNGDGTVNSSQTYKLSGYNGLNTLVINVWDATNGDTFYVGYYIFEIS